MLMYIKRTFIISCFIFSAVLLHSCENIDLYEKDVALPNQQWHSSFKPRFNFIIRDTTVPYQVYIVIRHNEKYNFNNLWLNLITKGPADSIQKVQYELPLASGDNWLGTAMDDLYEHRVALTPPNQNFYFKKAGTYTFIIEQIMREDPLMNVLNVGLRIEKKIQ